MRAVPAASRASLLRSALQQADSFAHEARVVLESQTADLASLQEAVSQITLPAQRLTSVQKGVERALAEVSFLLEQVAVPQEVEPVIRRGPAGGQEEFLEQLSRLEYCIECLSSRSAGDNATSSTALKAAINLRKEALQLCTEELRRLVVSSARVPMDHIKRAEGAKTELQVNIVTDDLFPAAAVEKARGLQKALQRNEITSSTKVYIEARTSVMENVQQVMGAPLPTRETYQMNWPAMERQAQRWAAHFTVMAGIWPAERQLAARIFGDDLGQVVFLKISQPWVTHVVHCAKALLEFGRHAEKVFSLLSLARRISLSLPRLRPLLPEELRRKLEVLLEGCIREAQATFCDYRTSLQSGIQRQTVGNGSVHPLSAQALGFLKRLLTNRFGARAIFASPLDRLDVGDSELSQHENAAISSGIREVLDVLWSALATSAKASRNEALAALFLMNNAHHQLKSVQAFGRDLTVSQDWQDRCEAKVEQYGGDYQRSAWDSILVLLSEGKPGVSSNKSREKASSRDRVKAANAALERLFEQQRKWVVPDAVLRENLKDVILEDFMPSYQEAWREFNGQSTPHPQGKLLRFSPEEVERIIEQDLFEGQAAPEGFPLLS